MSLRLYLFAPPSCRADHPLHPHTRCDAEKWAIVRQQLLRVLKMRAQAAKEEWWN